MTPPVVPVPRFWSPLSHEPTLASDGFLATSFLDGGVADGALTATDDLTDAPCLVLLGPPGSGKSTELRRLAGAAASAHTVDLGDLLDADDLRRDLLDHPSVADWRSGRADLTLFLDALDEGADAVQNIAAALRRRLDGPPGRLRLRITCRPTDWPETLGRHLVALFGETRVRTLTLAPLRSTDAGAIVRGALGDRTDAFLDELHRADATALAALPLTLRLLLTVYGREGHLPTRAPDLYERAVRHLCREWSPERNDARRSGEGSISDRLALASRVAAALRLSGRSLVHLGGATLAPPNSVTTDDLGPTHDEPPLPYPADSPALRDLARHAALFERAGPESVRFAHRAFGEYLAARYLHTTGTPADAALALLSHPDGGLLPQHRQTAGWLASLDPEVFDLLASREPGVALLYSPDPPPDRRERLLDAFFDACDRHEKSAYDPDRRRLAALAHPHVERQLRAVLADSDRSDEARRLALFVARDAGVVGLAPDALRLALDAESSAYVRYAAVATAAKLGIEREALLPLLSPPFAEDPGRDIAYTAREALFPSHLSIQDLARLAAGDAEAARSSADPARQGIPISDPHARRLRSLLDGLLRDLDTPGLLTLLDEAAAWTNPGPYEQEALSALASEAYGRLPEPSLGDALARILLGPVREEPVAISPVQRLLRHPWKVDEDDARRRALLSALARRGGRYPRRSPTAGHPLHAWSRLVAVSTERGLLHPTAAETRWMVEQLLAATSRSERHAWADLLHHSVRGTDDPERHEPVLEACLSERFIPELLPLYALLYAPQHLDSPEAEEAREWERQCQEVQRNREAERVPHSPPLTDRLDVLLSSSEATPVDSWREIRLLLDLDPADARRSVPPRDLGPANGPFWNALPSGKKDAVLHLCDRVVAATVFDADSLAETAEDPYGYALPPVEAFALLAQVGRFSATALPGDPLVALAAMALAHPYSGVDEVSRARDALRDEAWRRCPDALVAAVSELACIPRVAYPLLSHLLPLWDARLAEPFLSTARALPPGPSPSFLSNRRDEILDRLMGLGVEDAVAEVLAECAPLAQTPLPVSVDQQDGEADPAVRSPIPTLLWRSTIAFLLAPEPTWALLGPRILSDDAFGAVWLRAVSRRLGQRYHDLPSLPAPFLGTLYRRLHGLLQLDPGARVSGVGYERTTDDHVRDLEGALIQAFRDRATPDDLAELQRLHEELPEADLGRSLVLARRRHRELHPSYPSPTEALRLAADPQSRPIRSDAELQHAVVFALGRVQREIAASLQREASIFWEPVAPDSEGRENRPRDENYASDRIVTMLRRHLQPRGVLVDRETETNRGDRTDFLVQAPTDPTAGRTAPARVIVEVKGAWHREVETALDAQLGRYLRQSGLSHGVYLVLVFDPEAWSAIDGNRRRQGTRRSADELQEILTAQAVRSDFDIVPLVIEVPFGR